MGRQKSPVWLVLLLATISNGIAFCVSMIMQYLWVAAIVFAVTIASLLFWFYFMRHRKYRIQYPLVPPEGKTDVYFPRTKIPRPIYEDFRRMKERKRKLKKLRKMTRKKN